MPIIVQLDEGHIHKERCNPYLLIKRCGFLVRVWISYNLINQWYGNWMKVKKAVLDRIKKVYT